MKSFPNGLNLEITHMSQVHWLVAPPKPNGSQCREGIACVRQCQFKHGGSLSRCCFAGPVSFPTQTQ
jgi:hypothetical protein